MRNVGSCIELFQHRGQRAALNHAATGIPSSRRAVSSMRAMMAMPSKMVSARRARGEGIMRGMHVCRGFVSGSLSNGARRNGAFGIRSYHPCLVEACFTDASASSTVGYHPCLGKLEFYC